MDSSVLLSPDLSQPVRVTHIHCQDVFFNLVLFSDPLAFVHLLSVVFPKMATSVHGEVTLDVTVASL